MLALRSAHSSTLLHQPIQYRSCATTRELRLAYLLHHYGPDLFETALLLIVGGASICGVTAVLRRKSPDWRYVAAAMGALALDLTLLFHGYGLIPHGSVIPTPPNSTWNWEGKTLALTATLMLCALWPQISMRTFGFTLRQMPGSLGPACLAAALLFAIQWSAAYFSGDVHPPTAETLFFQATMPGLEEEPLWRGFMLVLLNLAYQDTKWKVLGTEIGWGAIATSIIFGLVHGIGVDKGAIQFSAEDFLLAGSAGFLLAWTRERTGSLVLPVIFHNIGNVGIHLLWFLP
jgi:membrane protease YdiL (CAAX protease family)